jgi:hypothetical protein
LRIWSRYRGESIPIDGFSAIPGVLASPTKLLRHPGRNVSIALPFFAQVVELVDTQVSEACA